MINISINQHTSKNKSILLYENFNNKKLTNISAAVDSNAAEGKFELLPDGDPLLSRIFDSACGETLCGACTFVLTVGEGDREGDT